MAADRGIWPREATPDLDQSSWGEGGEDGEDSRRKRTPEAVNMLESLEEFCKGAADS